MPRPQRFRDEERDLQTDIGRMRPIRDELANALAAVDREAAGLTRRLETARDHAATLLGTEDGIYYQREAADEAELVEAEAQMRNCYRRLEELQAQRMMLGDWRRQIEESKAGAALDRSGAPRSRGWGHRLRRLASGEALRRHSRVIAWLLAGIIVYATLIGIEHRPLPTRDFPDLGRILAFLFAAAAFAIGYPRHRLAIFGAGLVAIALLEAAQIWAPSRHGAFHDSIVKGAGLGLGILLVLLTERFRRIEGYS